MKEGCAEQLLSPFCPLHGVHGYEVTLKLQVKEKDGKQPCTALIFVSLPVLVSVASNFLRVNKGFCVLCASDLKVAPLDHTIKK